MSESDYCKSLLRIKTAGTPQVSLDQAIVNKEIDSEQTQHVISTELPK
jgi:hypothetical protein